ncbi:hypothetical protein [Arsenicibacter rosenii]|uniref:Uncharacterized protein n=1 Tax=Arsenicibacter rosenii TaxID=1750698 RepID=A0A1S2VJX7_9BACT|nr:hypothetical protein [Arsenicibacter rosenii]OIN59071.1 hypothetical protein BLX24_12755 [Arsenicibacter rosenii]
MKIKQTALITGLFMLVSLLSFGQKKAWKELDDYHSVMAQTFHPAEEGNLKPVMARSGELVAKAVALQKAAIPTDYQKEGVKQSIDLLAKESAALDKLVQQKKPEADIKKAITALHDRFHEVMEKCEH